ncbi:nipped-B-like protein isoform X2 [Ruditapes philippinarum]|nr:nipped-B-like protein isoform X2 [Ruditapes philippinarum]
MERFKRLRVSEVNPHLICVLCGGYYIDATTIIECLHTFCKTCIVGYLEASRHCPVCDNLVHKTKPHLRLRPDHTLQDLVYKLVPGLFQDEMKKRREFYKEEIESGRVGENGIPEERERIIYSADEHISLVIELSSDGNAPYSTSGRSSRQPRLEAADRRYLSCPGNFTVGHLKKFIKMKFNLCDRFQIDFYHTDETLHDHYTLVDIAYIYSWRRKGPLRLYYAVYTNQAKRFKADVEDTVPMETDATNASDLKTETSGYLTDDEKNISEIDKSFSQESDESKHDSVLEGDGIDIENKTVKIGDIKITEKPVISPDEEKPEKEKTENVKYDSKEERTVSGKKLELKDIPDKMKLDKTKDISECVNADSKLDSNAVESKADSVTDLKDKEKVSVDRKCEKPEFSGKENSSQETEMSKPDKCEKQVTADEIKKHQAKVKPEMVEASTGTCIVSTADEAEKCNIGIFKQSKSVLTDEDISEPVVSSTQNTQGCQTEPPGSSPTEKLDVPHSSEVDVTRSTVSPSCKSTADVSCETDNFVISRQMSVDSVSVSTETEKNDAGSDGKKLVDCSTDVYDFPKSESEHKLTVDCSTDFDGFPADSTKRKALSVDCSTHVSNLSTSSNKRKSIDNETNTESNKTFKKSDAKAYKRSYSYSGHLSTPKAAYLAQPLSPTKMKFTSPKSPVKTLPNSVTPKSPSRAETTGFQSQYQSFVRTEITYRFDEEDPPVSKHLSVPKCRISPSMSLSQSFSTSQKTKSVSKTGRPRGRPPKNRSLECLPLPKEKKHKSRSHSPKHRKNSEKEKEKDSNCSGIDKMKCSKSANSEPSKSPTAYSWINKIDGGSKQDADRKSQKSKQDSTTDKNASDLRIPKQFLYFSNGQYTIATVSSLSTLKQSSPVSPPPKTVFTADINGKNKTKTTDNEPKKQKYTPTTQSIKQSETKGNEKCEQKFEKPVDAVKTVQKKEKPKALNKLENLTESQTSHKIDSNQNRIMKLSTDMANQMSSVQETDRDIETNNKDTNKDVNKDISKEKPAASLPEYRHQSPFFASISNAAKLQSPHRPTAHLNVPNLSSHFSGTHHLYSQGRFTGDRLGTPIYRSFSMNDKSPTATMASKFEEARRFEAIASASQCGFLGPFPGPYLGLMHSHLVSSLPPPPPLSKPGHYPDSSRSLSFSESSNSLSQNTAKLLTKPTYTATPKGKEKSIDRIISAITEMRAKKETQEQLNGIDLSTKGNRQTDKSKEALNESKVDKFEFTDDDVTVRSTKKVTSKSESDSRKDTV